MKKQLLLILAIVLAFVISSCDTDMGTPPALVLTFSLDGYEDIGLFVQVDYTLTNDGDEDLENCKIQIGIDTDDPDEIEDYTYWTDGVDLDEGETYSVDDVNIAFSILDDVEDVFVLAAGFDNPPDAKSGSGRTIIYYNK